MSEWKTLLNANSLDWLLEKNNPSVRYFALTQILGKSREDYDVEEAKKDIMLTGIVPKILSKQNEGGYWEAPEKFYTAKYRGTAWQLIILSELGADEKDVRVKKACDFVLDSSQDIESGGFSIWASTKSKGGRHSGVIPCLTGNMVWSLIRLGFLNDERVKRGVNWIIKHQRFEDGERFPPKVWPYLTAKSCFGKHSCHMGVVKALKALSEIPALARSLDVLDTIDRGVEYVLKHHIFKRSHDLSRVSKPSWLKFGFPLMYQTDVLEILGILTKLGLKDKRMEEALALLISKQDEKGRWKLESTFNGRFQTNIERKGKESKWITLNAIKVLKNYYEK